MFKRFYLSAIIFALFSTLSFAQTEEGFEGASSSNLSKISLPANALRMSPDKVPAEITQMLDKFVEAGEGKFQPTGSEVLVWTGKEYQKIGQQTVINRLMDSMKAAGWKYEVGGVENGVTIFSLLKEGKPRRAMMGFYGESEGTLVLAWVEVLPNGSNEDSPQDVEQTEVKPINNSNRSIVGTWDNGRYSMVSRQNTITGATSPGSSTRFEYQFNADGKFSFTGLAQTVNYSCTDTLYNEKAGSYTLHGSTLTLIPSKNYWKKTNSCSPRSNSEKNHTLAKEVYQFSTKTNEYGQELICLTNNAGEACYRRKQ